MSNETKPNAENFEQILVAQHADFDSIKRHVNYLNSLDPDRRTVNILRNRCSLLEIIWRMCRDRNSSLIRIATSEGKLDNEYFKEDIFGETEIQLYEQLDDYSEIIQELQFNNKAQADSALQFNTAVNASTFQPPTSVIKLPRINLPVFSGLFSEWQSFKDSFNSLVIEDQNINNLSKLHYLKSSVTDEALDLICNVQITSDNFQVAWNLLTNRYDNRRAIVTAHINAIFSLEPLKKESAAGLLHIYNTVQKHLSALKNLNRPTTEYNDILINRLINLFDPKTQRDWEMSLASSTECPTYSDLEKFLLERIRVLEAIPSMNPIATSTPKPSSQSNLKIDKKFKRPNINAHLTSAKEEICILCKKNHFLYNCPIFKEKSIADKYSYAKNNKICTNCLRFCHKTNDCKSKFSCLKCKRRHHTLLHREVPNEAHAEVEVKTETTQKSTGFQIVDPLSIQTHYSNTNPINSKNVLLATARVWIISPSKRAIRVRALLDPGSTWSFISNDLAELIGSAVKPISASLSVLGGVSLGTATSAIEIGISPVANGEPIFETNALIIPKVTSYLPELRINFDNWAHLQGLTLADDPFNDDPIHVLIGAEMYSQFILDGLKKGKVNEPIAVNTIFGWVLLGQSSDPPSNIESNIQVHHCLNTKSLDMSLQKFWEVEEIPCKKILSLEEELCEEHFRKTHSRTSDGRYVVQLPFNSDKPIDIGATRHIAERSLKRLDSRLQKNPNHKELYVNFMKNIKH